jgi:hypothetical protein
MFPGFSTNGITIGLRNPQNLPSGGHFFAAILKVPLVARRAHGRDCKSS